MKMTDDPFKPKDIDYSMHEPETIPVPKYKDFPGFHYEKKLDILTDELVLRSDTTSVEVMLRDAGISFEEYKQVISNDEYLKIVREKSLKLNFGPYIPTIFEKLGSDAADGDPAAQKSALQLMGTIAPDNAIMINQNIINMTDAELKIEAEKLVRKLSE
jgi:hypothetical protein